MRKLTAWLFALLLISSAALAQTGNTPISGLPNASPYTIQNGDYIPITRSGVTYKATPWVFPSAGNIILSSGTGVGTTSLSPINGYCVVGAGGSWAVQPCLGNLIVGTPSSGNLTVFGSASTITNGNLLGDATTSGTTSVTVAKINGATLGSTTATSGNILVANGTQWQTQVMSGDCTMASNGAITCSNSGGAPIVTTTGTQTLTNKSISGSEINSGTVVAARLPTATTGALGVMQVGTGLSVSAGVVSTTNSGTVTSIATSAPITGGTITSTGTIGVSNATSGAVGVVQGDGSTLTINGSGVISCTTATSSQKGCVQPDGTTISVTSGTIKVAPMTALGVGSIIFAENTSGGNLSAGGTTAAANISTGWFATAGGITGGGDTLTGTWQALQAVPNSRWTNFQRTN